MPTFTQDADTFAYLDEGEGEPILLVHGFASNRKVNWVNTGWVDTLVQAGRRVIAIDNRGHGESAKFHSPADYAIEFMAGDCLALLDHLGLDRVDAMGYSLGARILSAFAILHPERLRSLILGGMGATLAAGRSHGDAIAAALEAPSVDMVTDPNGRSYRLFAEQTRSDLPALAACIRSALPPLTPEKAGAIRVPTLVAVGTRDFVAGSASELASMIPGAEVLDIPNRDHMLAVGDRVYKRGVVDFLRARSG